MSHPAICAAVAGWPKPYAAAPAAAGAASASVAASKKLADLDIAHGARCIDAPRLDRVVVIDRARAAHSAQLADRRLHEARVVDDARLQQRGTSVPLPVDAKARQCLV